MITGLPSASLTFCFLLFNVIVFVDIFLFRLDVAVTPVYVLSVVLGFVNAVASSSNADDAVGL